MAKVNAIPLLSKMRQPAIVQKNLSNVVKRIPTLGKVFHKLFKNISSKMLHK
jgi:hypothetical protein